ncbi:hypothetical protein RSAG8_12689, partial [Rhizoctonia solani AG-8 WAC10335]
MAQGLKQPFSILLLTDDYVLSADANKTTGDKLLIGNGNSLYTQAIDPPVLVAGRAETTCTFDEYMQAMPKYVELVREHLGDELAEAWAGHFTNVATRPFRSKIWHLLIRYDIEIRRLATERGFPPQNWHQNIFDEVKERYEREELDQRMAKLDSAINTASGCPVQHTLIHPNHKSALDRPDVIHIHINDEINIKRYFGPYSRDILEGIIGPFQTAPLGTVDKPSAPGKFRIVQDFSFPRSTPSTSLNSKINVADFPCEWGFFHDVVRAIHDLPAGSLAATCDVDAAFRQMPIHPDDRPHTVVHWDNQFYIDAFLPFGAASSNGIFGRPGDAMANIYTLLGFGIILKWVDDFLFIQSPPNPNHTHLPPRFSLEAIYEVADTLGWPWKLSKSVDFANIFTYLGFEWDIARRWVTIPKPKRNKYLKRLRDWLDLNTVPLKDTEKLVGSLIHCTLAIPSGRPHMAVLIAFEASFPQTHQYRFLRKPISDKARAEARWWVNALSDDQCGSSIAKPPPTNNIRVASDASTSFGLGVVIGDQWWSWRLLDGWKSENRDIGWAEAVALEFALDGVIALGISNASITFACDNQGVVYAWAKCRSRNPQQNAVFMKIMDKCSPANIHVIVEYIRSAENPADNPSRGIPPPSLLPSNLCIPIHSSYAPYINRASYID